MWFLKWNVISTHFKLQNLTASSFFMNFHGFHSIKYFPREFYFLRCFPIDVNWETDCMKLSYNENHCCFDRVWLFFFLRENITDKIKAWALTAIIPLKLLFCVCKLTKEIKVVITFFGFKVFLILFNSLHFLYKKRCLDSEQCIECKR